MVFCWVLMCLAVFFVWLRVERSLRGLSKSRQVLLSTMDLYLESGVELQNCS